jgi:hypothetical protein
VRLLLPVATRGVAGSSPTPIVPLVHRCFKHLAVIHGDFGVYALRCVWHVDIPFLVLALVVASINQPLDVGFIVPTHTGCVAVPASTRNGCAAMLCAGHPQWIGPP